MYGLLLIPVLEMVGRCSQMCGCRRTSDMIGCCRYIRQIIFGAIRYAEIGWGRNINWLKVPTTYKSCGLQPRMSRKESITPQLSPEHVSYLKNELDRFKAQSKTALATKRRSTKSPKHSLTAPKALGIACAPHLKENLVVYSTVRTIIS